VRGGIGLGWAIGEDSTVNFTETRTSFLADTATPAIGQQGDPTSAV
jgi:hypothetical protein